MDAASRVPLDKKLLEQMQGDTGLTWNAWDYRVKLGLA